MENYYCHNCESSDTYVKDYTHTFKKDNIEITITSEGRFCKKCDYPVSDMVLDDEMLHKAFTEFNRIKGFNPDDLIKLRKKYKLSQSAFSKIIGCAKKTLISYEKGTSVPNDNFLITIKSLIAKPELMVDLIQANKELYSDEELELINKSILKNMPNNINQLLFNDSVEDTEFNGNRKLSANELNNLILYLSKNSMFKTKLLKEFFYSDYFSKDCTGLPVTGLEYAKLPYGPVPDQFDIILLKMVNDGLISYDIEYKDGFEQHIIKALKEPDITVFTEYELACINHVMEYFEDYSVKDIVERSHTEKAWLETEPGEKISYKYASDIDLGDLTDYDLEKARKQLRDAKKKKNKK